MILDTNPVQELMDLDTLHVMQFGVMFAGFIGLQLLYQLDKSNAGIRSWRDGAFICAGAALALALFEHLPLALSVIPGVAGIMISYLLFWQGTRLLLEQPPLSRLYYWGSIYLILLSIAPTVLISEYGIGYGLRAIAMSLVMTLFPLLALLNLVRSHHGVTIGALLLVIGFSGTALFSLTRLGLTLLDLATKPKAIDLLSFFSYTILFVTLVLGVTILVHEKLQRQLKLQASTDFLTQLLNRRALYRFANKILAIARRNRTPVAAALFDLDDFKQINDQFGHDIGDLALQHFSQILKKETRAADICARIGGEEFLVLFPDTGLQPALEVCERIRRALESAPLQTPQTSIPITVSVGISSASPNYALAELLKQSDLALYQSKQQGKNRCTQAQETTLTLAQNQ